MRAAMQSLDARCIILLSALSLACRPFPCKTRPLQLFIYQSTCGAYPTRSVSNLTCCACTVAGTVLLGQTVEELGQLAKDTGQSAYRGKQLYDGLMHGARQLDHFNQVHHFLCALCCMGC